MRLICGCKLFPTEEGKPREDDIQFCPLHESAPELLEACRRILLMYPGNLMPEDSKMLKQSIAKAEPK